MDLAKETVGNMDTQKPETNIYDVFRDDEHLIVSVILNETVARDIGEQAIVTAFTQSDVEVNANNPIDSVDSDPRSNESKLSSELERVNAELIILQKQNEFLQQATNSGLWKWDSTSGKRTFDDQYALMAGYTPDEIKRFNARTWEFMTHPDDAIRSDKIFERIKKNDFDRARNNKRIRRRDGSWMCVNEQMAVTERDDDGKAVQIVGAVIDITEITNLKLKVDTLIDIDELTGLNNLGKFKEQFGLLDTHRRKIPVSIIYCEIDNYNKLNNIHGIQEGTERVISFAGILTNLFRLNDIVARVGDDRFGILLPDASEVAATIRVNDIRQCINDYNNEFPDTPLLISIGTATASVTDELKDADLSADSRLYLEQTSKEKNKKII